MAASPATRATRRAHHVAGQGRPHKKVSVTLPADLLDEIREKVGPGNLSRYLTEAVEDKRRYEALDEWLARMEAEHGPISPEAEAAAEQLWRGSGRTGG